MRRSALLAAAACLLAPTTVGAQRALELGDRVRIGVVAHEPSWVVGRVIANGEDSLGLALEFGATRRMGCDTSVRACARALAASAPDSFRIGFSEIAQVQHFDGVRRDTLRGGLVFGLVGGSIGALAASTCRECYTEWALMGAWAVGVPSFILGAMIGYFSVTEEWSEVEPPWSTGSTLGSLSSTFLRPTLSGGPGRGLRLAWSVR